MDADQCSDGRSVSMKDVYNRVSLDDGSSGIFGLACFVTNEAITYSLVVFSHSLLLFLQGSKEYNWGLNSLRLE